MRRSQNDSTPTSKATRNLVTNPELVIDTDDKVLYRNLARNPSFNATDGNTVVHTNLAINPTFEATSGLITTRTNLALNPSMENVSTGLFTVRTNLALNPQMNNFNFGGYGTQTLTALSVIPTHPDGLTTGVRVSYAAAAGNPGVIVMPIPDINTQYSVSAWVYNEGTTTEAIAIALKGNSSGGQQNVAPGVWTRLSWTLTTPAVLGSGNDFGVRIGVPTASGSFITTGVLIEKAPDIVPYFDGSTSAGTDDFVYSWSGAVNNSTSLKRGNVAVDFSIGSTLPISSKAWKRSGSRSLRLVATTTATNDTFTAASGDTGSMRLGMVAGKTYTFSATCHLEAPLTGTLSARSRKIVLFFKNAAAQTYSEIGSTQAPNTAGDTRVSLTFTLPADTTEAFVRIYSGAYMGNGDVWWDDLLIEEAADVRPYFDANNPIRNLIPNPSFEVDTQNWSATQLVAGFGRSTTRGFVGTSSLFGVAVDNQGDSMFTNTIGLDVNVGSTYAVSAYAWVPAGVVAADFRGGNRNLWAVAAVGGVPSLVTQTNLDFTKTNQWQRVSTTIKIPSGSNKLSIRLYMPANSLGIYWDAIQVEQSDTVTPYFEGTGDFTYSWNGTANASTSLQKAQNVASVGGANQALLYRTGTPGNYKGRLQFNGGTITDSGITLTGLANLAPSKWYTMSIDMTSDINRSVRFSTQGTGTVMSSSPVYPLVAGVTVRRSWTFATTATAPAGIALYVLRTDLSLGNIDFDNYMIEEGTAASPYFDGTTTNTADFTYAWTGTAHSSPSTQVAPNVRGSGNNYGGRVAWRSSDGPNGGKSVAILGGTPNADTFVQFPMLTGETLGGRTFTIIATRKTAEALPAGSDGRAWRVLWQVGKVGGGTEAYMSPIGDTTAGVYKVKWTFTFASDVTTTSFFRLYNGSLTAGSIVWWDDLAIFEGTYTGDYFDGDTADSSDLNYVWENTADTGDSVSQVRAMDVKGNWTSIRVNYYSSSVLPFSGSSKVIGSVTTLGYFPRIAYQGPAPIKGRRYTVIAKMKSTGPVQIALTWTGSTVNTVPVQSASNAKWVTISASSICPSDAAGLEIWIGLPDNTAIGTQFEIDNLMLVADSYDGPFCSGDTYGWKWEGTPHDSTSIGYPVGLMQLAGKPLFFGTTAGQTVLTDPDPLKNPVLASTAPRTVYSIVDLLSDIPSGVLDVVLTYGIDSLNDIDANKTMMFRIQSMPGELSTLAMRRTGGGGPIAQGIPAGKRVILIGGQNEGGYLVSGFDKNALVADTFQVSIPHERIAIAPNTTYHNHIATYIYPGLHSPAVRQEIIKLLAHEHNIPGM